MKGHKSLRPAAYLISAIILAMVFGGSGLAKESPDEIRVFVSILPQVYFVEKIAGEYAEVEPLVGPGQSPETYEPTIRQMTRLAESHVYFRIGSPFEKRLLEKIEKAFEKLNIIDVREGIELIYPDYGIDIDSTTAEPDPHVWLDPRNAIIIAENIYRGLCELDRDHCSEFEKNLQALKADLQAVDKKLAEILKPLRGGKFYVFHPAFGYFAERYGLEQVSIEVAGKEPSARQLAEIIENAKKDGIRVIFAQRQFSKDNAEAVARAINGAVVQLDPLAPDYISNLENLARELAGGLSKNGQ